MFNPMVFIPVEKVTVSVDHNCGDVRLIFRDVETIDSVIKQLSNVRPIFVEMEGVK